MGISRVRAVANEALIAQAVSVSKDRQMAGPQFAGTRLTGEDGALDQHDQLVYLNQQ